MSFGSARMDAAFDRWRTGDYGERQFDGQVEWEIFVEKTCDACPCEKWCPLCAKFYSGDDDLFDNPCIVIKEIMNENDRINYEMELKMEESYMRDFENDMIEESGVCVSMSANENWFNNYIQFARFIAECEASGCFVINQSLLDSMGLNQSDIDTIIERAQFAYEKICEQLKYRQEKENNNNPKNIMLNFNEKIFEKELAKAAAYDFD